MMQGALSIQPKIPALKPANGMEVSLESLLGKSRI